MMELPKWYLDSSEELAAAINNRYMPAFTQLIEETGLQGGDFMAAQTAVSTAPAPLTPDVFLARTPYQARASVISQLEEVVGRGVLTKVGDEVYALTEAGQKVAVRIAATAVATGQSITQTMPMESRRLVERVAAALYGLVQSCIAAPEPPHPCLERSRFFDPGSDAPIVERLRRYLNDLSAFRDDAHLAAWQPYSLKGHEWEAFSHIHGGYVFGERVTTAAELAEKLGSFRGYDAAAYEMALQKVVERGWLMVENGRYAPTAAGNQVREAVETETDRLFFTPWQVDESELNQLKTDLEWLIAQLQVSQD
ncbi:MAG TPA: hypothetical protein PLD25_05315 [Chloroflexota bacterium]|nr:hypothetical protein [Chloroflexota bacterium]HUM69824.1 hypothetical protein [Chloroflexota bacterium]